MAGFSSKCMVESIAYINLYLARTNLPMDERTYLFIVGFSVIRCQISDFFILYSTFISCWSFILQCFHIIIYLYNSRFVFHLFSLSALFLFKFNFFHCFAFSFLIPHSSQLQFCYFFSVLVSTFFLFLLFSFIFSTSFLLSVPCSISFSGFLFLISPRLSIASVSLPHIHVSHLSIPLFAFLKFILPCSHFP